MHRYSSAARAAAVLAVSAVVSSLTLTSAAAADGDVRVVNTETVQVYTSPTGQVETSRVYEQIDLTGNGTVELRNPVSADGLRNLDGFGGWEVRDGEAVINAEVEGEERLRAVSDFDGELPLSVQVVYTLDGKRVEPGDVVGADGRLEVQYTVTNRTGVEQEISYDDGQGGTVTETVEVPIPIVGSLTVVAPSTFQDVQSEQANIAGDGKGGTKLSFTMTLFPPLASTTAVFGYSADIEDGVVPRADISALPVNPLRSPSFATAANSYQGGADSGAELADGAVQIDSNLLKLRDGAADLLAGLLQLEEGSGQLRAGLEGAALPGSRQLADGAGELDSGLGLINSGARRLADGTGELVSGAGELADGSQRLDAGAGRLADGAGRLASGTGDALAGGKKLTAGLQLIDGGLGQLADSGAGLPAAQAGITQLQGGVAALLAGFGDAGDPDSLIGGLAALEAGLTQLEGGQAQLVGGLDQVADGLPTAKGGVDQVKAGLDDSLAPGGSLDRLAGGLAAVRDNFCATHQTLSAQCTGTVEQLITGVGESRDNLTLASGGLGQVSAGLASAIGGLDTQIIPGAVQVRDGLTSAKAGATKLEGGAVQLRGGVTQVGGGLDQLAAGVSSAVSGVFQLAAGSESAVQGSSELTSGLGRLDAGAAELASGAGELADGTGQLDDGVSRLGAGAGQLNDGAGQLADGTGDAKDGSGRLADGAGQLADGLQDAAAGSGRLNDGLGQAADGAPKLVDGAQRLSDEGAKKLVEAGEETAQDFGARYAVMAAGAERANTENMAYGAPEGATGLTAYSFVIQGDDGESSRNWARGLGGLTVLGAGAGVLAFRRRLI